ncbi:MAG: deoxyribodipyrimidine photo-lyase [Thermodesulfobacteriota bacterium]
MIHDSRIQVLHDAQQSRGEFVLYWMQAAQRSRYNHALEYAIRAANARNLPVVAFFGLTWQYPEANQRHYRFLIDGLKTVQKRLADKGILLAIQNVSPEEGALSLSERAAMVVVDRGYLHIQKQWRQALAAHIQCPLIQVESEVIVPVETAMAKEAYSAAVLRRKIKTHLDDYLVALKETRPKKSALDISVDSLDARGLEQQFSAAALDASVAPVADFPGGPDAAEKRLSRFIGKQLADYNMLRNDPSVNCQSDMSPYLHFGQISPLYIARQLMADAPHATEAYLEQLIVRRELSMNFAFYNPDYATFAGLPAWAKKTLAEHGADVRDYCYRFETLESANTHDPYWNAAQNELRLRGKIHGYMRMYWGKKILEWSETPETAFSRSLYLNNRYALDGRDPNSYAGILWCFGKHDRPWPERPIFGKVRYMNDRGLKRKFNVDAYVEKINQLG